MSAAKKLYEIRKKLGLGREKLGKALGVSEQSIYFWETGQRKLSIKTALKLIAVAKKEGIFITLDEIFKEKE